MKKARFDFNDAIVFIGALVAIFGIWQIYHPAAYIVAGAALVTFGIMNARTGG